MGWRHDGGFTLIEVLVALFVVAVGLAGAGASQLAARRARHGAELVAEGTRLAASLAERMRANRTLAFGPTSPYLFTHDAAHEAAPAFAVGCFGATDCSPAQMAEFDVAETVMALRERFPGGQIVVCRDGAALAWDCDEQPDSPLVIKLGWRGNEAEQGAGPLITLQLAGAI